MGPGACQPGANCPWGELLTPFSSLQGSLWTPRSLATYPASSQVLPGSEACWPGLDSKAQGPTERRPEDTAWLTGSLVCPGLGRIAPMRL